MNNYLHNPNLIKIDREPHIIWNSKALPIPIDFFKTQPTLNNDFQNKNFSFWITINPALSNDSISKMLKYECVDTIRISSSKYASVKELVNEVKRIKMLIGNRNISLALDFSGPKVRISKLDLISDQNKLVVFKDEVIALICESNLDLANDIRFKNLKVVPYLNTVSINKNEKFLLISDGWNQFEIIYSDEIAIYCRALNDSVLFNHRGIDIKGMYDQIDTIPTSTINLINDLMKSGILSNFKWLCLSFCNSKVNVQEFRKLFLPFNIKLMSKIETLRGIKNINEICSVSEGIMIARGDLAVQLALYGMDILDVEDSIRESCINYSKKCVIATRIGDSLDGFQDSLSSEEIFRIKHELLFSSMTNFMLTNEVLENESSFKNFSIILKTINDILQT